MALTASVTLRRGRFDAGSRDDRYPEFIPSPFRLFCALVAVAARTGDPRDRVGLRWLEKQDDPVIHRPPVLDASRDETFFVTNRVAPKGGSMSHPGRVNGLKHRAWVSFEGDRIHFTWNADPPPDVLADLHDLATGIGYFGRVESAASVQFLPDRPSEPGRLEEFEPVSIGEEGHAVAVPFSGVVDELVAAHERGESAWQTARWAQYGQPTDEAETVHRGPFGSLLVFALEGQPVGGSHLLDATSAFRAAVMSRIKDIVGPARIFPTIHGHERDVEHVAYLGLPFVASRHADGDIRGFALALPRGLASDERSVILDALVGNGRDDASERENGLREITYARARGGRPGELGKLNVRHEPFPDGGLLTLRPSRWMGGAMGRKTWTTVSPAMLDRHPKKSTIAADIVVAGLVRDGYPEPISIEVGPTSSLRGAIRYRGSRELIRRRQARPLVHVTLTFPVPVVGPLLIGSLRYLGGGLCIPVKPWREKGESSHVLQEAES